jgi:hypothetical protein
MGRHPERERLVKAYTAGSATEAMVIRALLKSSGIISPDPVTADPFPLDQPPEGMPGPEIYVLESQADEARGIIESYKQEAESSTESDE